MAYNTLLFDVADHVATITIDRPQAANALNDEMGKELFDAILRSPHRSRHSGRHFRPAPAICLAPAAT